jgi:hypothetical protein
MSNLRKATGQSMLSRRLVAIALCSMMALLAPAAGAQVKNSSGLGPSASTLGGGASGASNRGGAGGVSNPSPGGSSASLGGPGQSSGPQATEGSRTGYAGGRSVDPTTPPPELPSVDPTTPPPEPPSVVPTLASVTQFGKCPTVGLSAPQARMSDNNMGRIDTVARYLGQGREPQAISTTRYLLADMQEELEKPSPDLMLTASYMGIASAVPVTPELVYEVGHSLCATVSRDAAKEIAVVAEEQRKRLLLGAKPNGPAIGSSR